MIFRAPPASALLVEPLDALTAVFHRPSGTTHLLAEPAPEILATLGGDGLTADQLWRRLGERFDLAEVDRAALAARLEELVAAGLVSAA